MRTKRRHARTLTWQINVTPFVDVMLVLLIVFMVTAPMLSVGVPVKLPKVSAEKILSKQKPIIISVQSKGQIYMGRDLLTLNALIEHMSKVSNRDVVQIFLRADARVPYGTVMRVMGSLNREGFHNISLITQDVATSKGKRET